MSITRINQFQAQAGKGLDLKELLTSFIPAIKEAEGCEGCQLLISHANPDRMVMLEVWSGTEAHLAATRNIADKDIKKLMDLVASPPKGGFYTFT